MIANFITQHGKFDAGHRVMHERFKCFNIHGHEYHYELTFSYRQSYEIGYAIDFKEIKRVACQWLDEAFDHGFIANPKDEVMIAACRQLNSKFYLMHLVDREGFCNPSAENIAREMFFGVSVLLDDENLKLVRVQLHETINCYVTCEGLSGEEAAALRGSDLYRQLIAYRQNKGLVEYDDRRCR